MIDDPQGAVVTAGVVILFLWLIGVIPWLWRCFVVRPITTRKWKPRPTRPPMPQELRQHIFARDGYACRVPKGILGKPCGRTAGNGDVLEPHHWLPWKHFPGLFYATWNLVTACRECNRSLGAKIPRYAYHWDDPEAANLGRPGKFKKMVIQPDIKILGRKVA